MALHATVPAHPHPSLGLARHCSLVSKALVWSHLRVHWDRILEINEGNSLWRWLGVRDKQLSLLQSSGSLVPGPLSRPWHNTARGEGEKGPWSIFPVCFKYFPLHKHLQLFIEHWSAQHLNFFVYLWNIYQDFKAHSWDVLDWPLWSSLISHGAKEGDPGLVLTANTCLEGKNQFTQAIFHPLHNKGV